VLFIKEYTRSTTAFKPGNEKENLTIIINSQSNFILSNYFKMFKS